MTQYREEFTASLADEGEEGVWSLGLDRADRGHKGFYQCEVGPDPVTAATTVCCVRLMSGFKL